MRTLKGQRTRAPSRSCRALALPGQQGQASNVLIGSTAGRGLCIFVLSACLGVSLPFLEQQYKIICRNGTPHIVLQFNGSTQQPIFSLFFLFRATLSAFGSSQVRGQIIDAAASLHHSHSNTSSEPNLQPTPQLTATLKP